MNKQEIEKAIVTAINLKDRYWENDTYTVLNDTILPILYQQLNNGWIPVSERLPEKDGWYLISIHKNWVPQVDKFEKGNFSFYAGMVEAWQPLPQAYKGE